MITSQIEVLPLIGVDTFLRVLASSSACEHTGTTHVNSKHPHIMAIILNLFIVGFTFAFFLGWLINNQKEAH